MQFKRFSLAKPLWYTCHYTITKVFARSAKFIRHLLCAHGCIQLTCSVTKTKRALSDVVQFVVDHNSSTTV